MEGRAETSPARSTFLPSLIPGFARGLEVPRTSGNGEKLPAELHRKNSKAAESVGGKTFPRSNLPARRKEFGVWSLDFVLCPGHGRKTTGSEATGFLCGSIKESFPRLFSLLCLFFKREKELEEGVEVK